MNEVSSDWYSINTGVFAVGHIAAFKYQVDDVPITNISYKKKYTYEIGRIRLIEISQINCKNFSWNWVTLNN